MRIAFLTEKYPPDVGGLAASAARLVEMLTRFGVEVHIFTPAVGFSPGQISSTRHDQLCLHRFGIYRRTDDSLAFWSNTVIAQHQQSPFDLIHAYFITQAGFVAAYSGCFLGLPVIVSARGNDLDRSVFDPGKAAHVIFTLSRAHIVTTNCGELSKKARTLVPDCQVEIIPNGVDCQLFQSAPKDEIFARSLGVDGVPVLGFVGEARSKKGLASLLLAYKIISQQKKAALLLVGGVREGEDKEMFTVFRKQNPDLMIELVPYRPLEDLPRYYSLMDILLMPSLRDGLPNTLLEAMACERAVIASRVGGMIDVIRDNENGILVPPANIDMLVAGVLDLLNNDEKRLQLGRSARLTVLSNYTLEQELNANLMLYHRLIK